MGTFLFASALTATLVSAYAAQSFLFSSHSPMQQHSSSSSCGPTGCGLPLTDEQKKVLYEKGTEAPFTSPLYHEHRAGTYVAADTGEALFRSEAKFDSGTGWPSFYEPIDEDVITLQQDSSWGMSRTEVMTKNGSHLGHVFDDGPEPTGKRYCINGAALRFVPDEQ